MSRKRGKSKRARSSITGRFISMAAALRDAAHAIIESVRTRRRKRSVRPRG